MKINHNIPALQALNELSSTETNLQKSLERLSSGLKINSAADDAAGMAISEKMTTQINGLDQANDNSSDAISLVETAEGALSEVEEMLQRIRELSVQAVNDTYNDDDRESIQAEVDELLEEIQRISEDTEFNDTSVLDGNLDYTVLSSDDSVGDVVSEKNLEEGSYTITVTQSATQTTATGDSTVSLFDASGEATESGTIEINGVSVTISEGDTQQEVYDAIADACDTAGVDVSYSGSSTFENGATLDFTVQEYGSESFTVSGDTDLLSGLGLSTTTVTTGDDLTYTTSGFSSDATFEVEGNDLIINMEGNDSSSMKVETGTTGTTTIDVLSEGTVTVQVGANQGQTVEIRIPDMGVESLGITDISLETSDDAEAAISEVDDAISYVSQIRSRLGAYENRLEYTISNLDSSSENMESALSQIQDVDMAEEMTKYTEASVLQQAGISMVSQANQLPETLLQLLQG